jgi:hypothetical protein
VAQYGPVEAILVRRRFAWALPGIAALAMAMFFAWATGESALLGAFLVSQLVIASLAGWLAYWRPHRDLEQVSVDEEGLRLGAYLLRSRRWIRRGDLAATPDARWRVDIHALFQPRVRLVLSSAEEGRQLLAALGLDRREGTSRFKVRLHAAPSVDAAAIGTAFAFFFSLFLLGVVPSAWVLLTPLLVPLCAWLLWRAKVTVGADGIERQSIFGRRFVAHADVFDVRQAGDEVILVMNDGRTMMMDTRGERIRAGVWRKDPVFDAIFTAWHAQRGLGANGPAAATTLLARGARPVREWLASLRRIGGDAGAGYRVAPLEERDLIGVLSDAQAPAELRVGAAVALGANKERAPRLRVAADDVADPVVRRIALAATEEDDDSLEIEVAKALRA